MGVFGDNFRKYYEIGLSCVPIKPDTKRPLLNNWQKYCDELPTIDEVNDWESRFGNDNKIGLCLGKASGVVAFDYDYEFDEAKVKIERKDFEKDQRMVEKMILSMLPPTHCVKKGKKGWTRFYKWTPALDASSNLSCDRNGIRLFDFLSWHKQTIIPPSIHSIDTETGQAIFYKWTGTPIDQCFDELPEIDLDIIKELNYVLSDSNDLADENSRHKKLFNYALSILNIEKDINKLAKSLVKKDAEINNPPYLTDKKHHKTDDALLNANKWLDRIVKYASNKKLLKSNDKKTDKNSWDYFFENQLFDIRKDILSEKIFVKRKQNDHWQAFEIYDGYLRSYAKQLGMPKSDVVDEMSRYVIEKEVKEFLIDIPTWDGTDYLKQITKCIYSDYYTQDEIYKILHDWGVGIFLRLYTFGRYQNRSPILMGGQGIGKDELVRNMVDAFTTHYYGSPVITKDIMSILEAVTRLLVVHVAEFDQTSSISNAQLKDLITSTSSVYREKYGRAATPKQMSASWISTVNTDDFFRDPTGNRRFIPVPITKIDWAYPKGISLNLISQWYAAYKINLLLVDDDLNKKIKKLTDDLTPESTSELILDAYVERFKEKAKADGQSFRGHFLNSELDHLFLLIARDFQVSQKRVRTIVKAAGMQKIERIDGVIKRAYYCKPIKTEDVTQNEACNTSVNTKMLKNYAPHNL